MNSKVSVIIPVYNQEKYIEQAISSACEQTYKNIEVIVINDGSTDKTEEIISSLLSKYPSVKYIVRPNRGVSKSRNTGIEKSEGLYIAFLDGDDYWDRTKVELMTNFLDCNPDIGLVHSNARVVNENSVETGEVFVGREGNLFNELVTFDGLSIPPPSNVMIRRAAIQKTGLFDSNLEPLEDQDFFIRISRHYKIGKIDKALGYYRMHEENTHQKAKYTTKGFLALKNKLKTYELPGKVLRKGKGKIYILIAFVWKKSSRNIIKVVYYLMRSFITSPLDFTRYFYLKLRN